MCLSTTPVLSSKTFHINTSLDLCSRIGWTVMEFAWCGIATCWALIQRRAAIHSPRTPLSIFSCSLHHMKAFELFSSLHINPPRPLLVWKTLRTVLWRFGAVSVSLSPASYLYMHGILLSSPPPVSVSIVCVYCVVSISTQTSSCLWIDRKRGGHRLQED